MPTVILLFVSLNNKSYITELDVSVSKLETVFRVLWVCNPRDYFVIWATCVSRAAVLPGPGSQEGSQNASAG